MESRFGTHVHILNWALHLDEGTPHIQERHVFDCKNQYGELCPQQEKALEELGIPLPDPSKPKGRHNNRKQTFDAMCREMLFEICERYGLQLDREQSTVESPIWRKMISLLKSRNRSWQKRNRHFRKLQ